jgi:quinol monooxygenase YgiN
LKLGENLMINVIASIRVKEKSKKEFIEIFKSNIPNVLREEGCIEYSPTVDINADLGPQQLADNIITVIEKWSSLKALKDHLKAPHMEEYRIKVRDMVLDVGLKVLQEI